VDKSDLIRTIREAYQRMGVAIDRVDDERLLEAAMDDWTGKDLLVHMAWWHDHSALVIDALRAGRKRYDDTDPANTTDAFNERTHREHLDDPPDLTRRAFNESFAGFWWVSSRSRTKSCSPKIAGHGWVGRPSPR
jgi:hypothetical protein